MKQTSTNSTKSNVNVQSEILDVFHYVSLHDNIGNQNKVIGIWIDGDFSWINEMEWDITSTNHYDGSEYRTYKNAVNHKIDCTVLIEEVISTSEQVLVRKCTIQNRRKYFRDCRLFFYQDLSSRNESDVVFFAPKTNKLFHYVNGSYVIFHGEVENSGISQYATGINRSKIDDEVKRGLLSYNPLSSQSISSTFSLDARIKPKGRKVMYTWAAFGKTVDDAQKNAQEACERKEMMEKYISFIL